MHINTGPSPIDPAQRNQHHTRSLKTVFSTQRFEKNITTSKRQHVWKARRLVLGCHCSGLHRFRCRHPYRLLPDTGYHFLLPPLRIHLPLDLQLQIRWLLVPLAPLICTADVSSFLIDTP